MDDNGEAGSELALAPEAGPGTLELGLDWVPDSDSLETDSDESEQELDWLASE